MLGSCASAGRARRPQGCRWGDMGARARARARPHRRCHRHRRPDPPPPAARSRQPSRRRSRLGSRSSDSRPRGQTPNRGAASRAVAFPLASARASYPRTAPPAGSSAMADSSSVRSDPAATAGASRSPRAPPRRSGRGRSRAPGVRGLELAEMVRQSGVGLARTELLAGPASVGDRGPRAPHRQPRRGGPRPRPARSRLTRARVRSDRKWLDEVGIGDVRPRIVGYALSYVKRDFHPSQRPLDPLASAYLASIGRLEA